MERSTATVNSPLTSRKRPWRTMSSLRPHDPWSLPLKKFSKFSIRSYGIRLAIPVLFSSLQIADGATPLIPSPPTAFDVKPIFGSVNGYDAGDTNAVCWASTFDELWLQTLGEPAGGEDANVFWMNRVLSNHPEEANFQQFPSCLDGTSLEIRVVSQKDATFVDSGVLWHGGNVTLQVDVQTDIMSYGGHVVEEPEMFVWYRIFKCSANRVGYCQPFLDSYQWDVYLNEATSVVAEHDLSYEPGQVLETRPTDTDTNVTYTTRWIEQKLTPVIGSDTSNNAASSVYGGSLNITVTIWNEMQEKGYNVIAHAILQLKTNAGEIIRVDMSNKVPGVMGVATHPEVSSLSKGIKIFVGILIALAGSISLGMFCFICYHRDHKIMTMAQGGLLGWLAAASFITICFSFLIMPTQDIFCELNGLLFISGTMMPCILIGRLWRAYSTLSVALRLGRSLTVSDDEEKKSTYKLNEATRDRLRDMSNASEHGLMAMLSYLACSPCFIKREKRHTQPSKRRTTSSFRRTTTRKESVTLILCLTLPQVILQISSIAVFRDWVYIDYSIDNASARQVCYTNADQKWIFFSSCGYLAFTYILAMYVAWCSRHLPSAFNEKDEVFKAGFISAVVVGVVTTILALVDAPPNLNTILAVLMVVLVSLIPSWLVIFPKIRRVRSGETVVMTNILRKINGQESASSDEAEYRRASEHVATRLAKSGQGPAATAGRSSSPSARVSFAGEETRTRHASEPATVKYNEPIPRKVERQLYLLHDVVESITVRCAEGKPLRKHEWNALQCLTSNLTTEFQTLSIKFESESENSDCASGPKENEDDAELNKEL